MITKRRPNLQQLEDSLGEGWKVIPYGGALLGYQAELILITGYRENANHMRKEALDHLDKWLVEEVPLKLTATGRLFYI